MPYIPPNSVKAIRNEMEKVITIKQPYAHLIITGKKTLEIRNWNTAYRGRIYIHVSRKPVIGNLIVGHVIGYVDLIDTRPMTYKDTKKAYINYIKNAVAWVLANPQRITPIPLKGQLGIFGINLKDAVKRL